MQHDKRTLFQADTLAAGMRLPLWWKARARGN
jgi:hypothetical protein